MQRVYTRADYEVKQGRFLILSTISRDRYTAVTADLVDGTEEAYWIAVSLQDAASQLNSDDKYWIHDGFIIASAHDSRECAQTLSTNSWEEATESLNRFLADLNAYPGS